MVERLHKRQAELERERQITALPPVLKGAALVIPKGLLDARRAHRPMRPSHSASPKTRRLVQLSNSSPWTPSWRRNVHSATAARDVSAEKKGWDIESRDPQSGHLRFIEVKGRHVDARDVIITKNEILASLNAPDAFILALVRVANGFSHEPIYVRRFFKRELGFAETAVVFNIDDLVSLGRGPHVRTESQTRGGGRVMDSSFIEYLAWILK